MGAIFAPIFKPYIMAKKQAYTKAQRKKTEAIEKKLKYYNKKYNEIREIKAKSIFDNKGAIGSNGKKISIDRFTNWDSKTEIENYLKEQRNNLAKKLGKSKIYQTKQREKTNKTKQNVEILYDLKSFKFWERNDLINYIEENEIDNVNGIDLDTRADKVYNEIDNLFAILDSTTSLTIIRTSEKNSIVITKE